MLVLCNGNNKQVDKTYKNHIIILYINLFLRRGQVVRQRVLVPPFVGSNPTVSAYE